VRTRTRRAPLPSGFGTIWTSVALDLVGFGIVLPLLPLYARRFGASALTATALVAAFSAAQLLFAPLWGRASDRIGRKPLLLLSMAGTAAGSLLTGLAGSLPLLFVGRVVDGISGSSVSVAQAAVSDVAPPGERARLLGLLGAAFGVGFVAGPAIGALAALGGPRVPFLLAGGLAAVNAVVAARRLPETHTAEARVESAPPVHAERTLPRESLGVGQLIVLAFVALVAFSAFEVTLPLFGRARLGFGQVSTGAVFAGVGILLALVQGGLVRPAVARLGEGGTLRGGLALNAVGLLLLAAVHSWWALVPALASLTVGQGLAMPALTSVVAGRAHAHRRGGVLGVQQSAGGLARVVGPVAGGAAFQHVGLAAPYLGGAVLMAACVAAAGVTAAARS